MRGLLANSLETAALTEKGFQDVGKGPGSRAGEFIEWLTIRDQEQSVRDDVQRIRESPLVPKKIAIYGYVYDVKSGRLLEVPEAKRPGEAAVAWLPKTQVKRAVVRRWLPTLGGFPPVWRELFVDRRKMLAQKTRTVRGRVTSKSVWFS
jgi:hypothetical protein